MRQWAKLILFLLSIITCFLGYKASQLEVDYDYEKYFPKSDDSMIHYEDYRKHYGEDSDFLLVGLENESGIFNVEFLKKVENYGNKLLEDTLIDFVLSPVHHAGYYKKAGLNGIIFKPFLNLEDKKITQADSLRILNNPLYRGNLIAENGSSICLYIKTKTNLNKAEARHVLDFLEKKKNEFQFDHYYVAGRVLAQTYFVQKMINELGIFMTSAICLLIIFLYISFRSWWGILIPLLVIIVAIIWTLAIMKFTGKSFDLLMVMLPTIIFVVGMSDLVHLLTKYLDELRKGKEKETALKIAFKEVRWATFLTSLTTSIGFFSLVFANILPIKEFGIYAGISVFVAYFLAFTLLPCVLLLVQPPQKIVTSKHDNFWDKYLRKWFLLVIKGKRKVVFATLILVIIGCFTASKIQINNYLLEDLSDNDPVKKDVLFFENNYSGLRPFEAELYTSDSAGILGFEFLQELEKLENYLKTNYTANGVGFLMSPLTGIKEANFIKKGSHPKDRRLPKSERRLTSLKRQMKRGSGAFNALSGPFQFNLIGQDSMSGRLTGKLPDVGKQNIDAANLKLKRFMEENIDEHTLSMRLTGTAALIDKNNGTLVTNLILGLLLAFAVIALVVGIMFRSFKISMLSLIPNLLPLLLVTTVMWLGGINLNISTSLIFTLAFGIAVDDTIHLLTKYKLERSKNRSHLYSLKRSYLSSGKAVIVTTLILCGGFLTLMFSSFTSTFYMGLLVSVTLFIALILDLMIMPLIILWGLSSQNKR